MVGAGFVLVASELAGRAKGFFVEPVTVGVEVILRKILIPIYVVFFAKFLSFLPGGRFDFEALDV